MVPRVRLTTSCVLEYYYSVAGWVPHYYCTTTTVFGVQGPCQMDSSSSLPLGCCPLLSVRGRRVVAAVLRVQWNYAY
jgi:hypothetical protein